jgi:hypothetical protein
MALAAVRAKQANGLGPSPLVRLAIGVCRMLNFATSIWTSEVENHGAPLPTAPISTVWPILLKGERYPQRFASSAPKRASEGVHGDVLALVDRNYTEQHVAGRSLDRGLGGRRRG